MQRSNDEQWLNELDECEINQKKMYRFCFSPKIRWFYNLVDFLVLVLLFVWAYGVFSLLISQISGHSVRPVVPIQTPIGRFSFNFDQKLYTPLYTFAMEKAVQWERKKPWINVYV